MNFNAKQLQVINATEPKILCLAAAASGKALPNSSHVPTPCGFCRVDEIETGDYLLDENGEPTKVLGVFPQGNRQIYKMKFEDGSVVECSKDHLWHVCTENEPFVDLTTEQILQSGKTCFIPTSRVSSFGVFVNEPNRNDFYFLGLGFDSSEEKIDFDFFFKSFMARMMFVRGVMDVGGSVNSAGELLVELKTEEKATLFRFLLNSLGFRTTPFENVDNKIRFTIKARNSEKALFFKNKEKAELANKFSNLPDTTDLSKMKIVSIEPTENKTQMTCFYVENPTHLFLCENFIVTHNTRVLTERIRRLVVDKQVPPSEIVAITFTNMAAEEMKRRLGDISEDMFIGTLHSFAAKICNMGGIDISIYLDEGNEEFDKILEKAMTVRPHIYPKISHLLIDETQDLDELNYKFIAKIPTENIFYVGDARQMIYMFKGASMKSLRNIYDNPEFVRYHLIDNYRNTPQIIKFAEHFLVNSETLSPEPKPVKTKGEQVVECGFLDALDDLTDSKNWGSWFILCRTNQQVNAVQGQLEDREIPYISFKKGDFTLDEINELMTEDKVKVLTVHSAKGLESPNVIVTGCKCFNEEEKKICYVAATRAENMLYWTPGVRGGKKPSKSPLKNSKEIIQF